MLYGLHQVVSTRRAVQVEDDAKMLRKTTEQLAERTEALKQELTTQKEEFSQRLFEAQQENNQVCTMFCSHK